MAQFPSNSSGHGIWTLQQQRDAVRGDNWPIIIELPEPPVSGYIAWYDADSISGTTWTDKTGNGYDASLGGTGFSVVSTTGNGATESFNALQGSTASTVVFPSGILPSTYTLFYIARYNGTNKERILQGQTINWLSGFWDQNTGVAYHSGWLTPQTDIHSNNWFYSTDQKSLYRSNGVTRSTGGGGATSDTIGINSGAFASEASDFMIAEIIVYASELNSTDYAAVESYLATKYGV